MSESASALSSSNFPSDLTMHRFAPEAAFKNPALSYTLPVTCQHCTTSRVLDVRLTLPYSAMTRETDDVQLTRDADLLSLDDPQARKHWSCLRCGHVYDRSACEAALVEGVVRQMSTYQMQDLRCSRCKQIKSTNLAVHCECSGVFRTTEARGELLRRFRVASAVAEWYGFEAFGDVVGQCIDVVG